MTFDSKLGLMIAAPSSGSGKTLFTLALLRALRDIGCDVSGAKVGPDYIDPGFHKIACGNDSVNLDGWAMDANRLRSLAGAQPGDHLLVEGVMGLFDGASDGSGSTAEIAKVLDIPVLLVVDAARQSHSVAALVRGFRDHDSGINLAGVVLNRVGSSRHESMLRQALEKVDVRVFGALPRNDRLVLPERHLGLVQAGEVEHVADFVAIAAGVLREACDLAAIRSAFTKTGSDTKPSKPLLPLGQRIAIAKDKAFSFMYRHMLEDWKAAGAELSFFSPLGDEVPNIDADSIFLPGGYPELHGGEISSAGKFKTAVRKAAQAGALVYGECGGYMVLGEGLIDADGKRHSMLGLLNLETSFAERKLHLGYRQVQTTGFPLGQKLNAHEFHYSSVIRAEGEPLFKATDAVGAELGAAGLRVGNVMGSYFHVIDGAAT